VSTYVQQASNIGQHYYPETMGEWCCGLPQTGAPLILAPASSPLRQVLHHRACTGRGAALTKLIALLQNAPYIFTTVWSVVKGWLDPVTVEKIKILGSGYEKELTGQVRR